MEAVILVIHLIVALSIIAVVLIQPSEAGGFLGSSGSMSNMMAPRRTGESPTRLTTILAGIFFLTSLSLAIIAEHRGPAQSILDVVPATPSTTQTAPTVPGTPAAAPAAEKMAPAPDAAALKTVPAAKTVPATPQKGKPAAPISK